MTKFRVALLLLSHHGQCHIHGLSAAPSALVSHKAMTHLTILKAVRNIA